MIQYIVGNRVTGELSHFLHYADALEHANDMAHDGLNDDDILWIEGERRKIRTYKTVVVDKLEVI